MSYVVPPWARMEVKFEATETRVHEILHWIRLHPARFHQAYPPRRVNSVYFDSPDLRAISDNLAGISARTKVRLRWYGENFGGAPGALELKRKRNGFGWKLRYDVAVPAFRHGASWRAVRQEVAKQLPQEGRHWLAISTLPILINSYHRRYYLSGDERVRITVDTAQRVWDQRLKPYLNLRHRSNLPRTLIVEVKFERRDLELASSIVQGVPIRVSRHSKYLTGSGAALL